MAMSTADRYQRAQYGGLHWGTAFFGWLVATGMEVLLLALLTAAGGAIALTAVGGTNGLVQNAGTVGLVSGLLMLAAMAAAYYAGGYAAGRMSRFDGARQGLGVWLFGLIATIALAAAGLLFGTNFNLLQQLNLPAIPVNGEQLTTGGAITLLLAAVASLLAAMAGGRAGEAYHRRVDRTHAKIEEIERSRQNERAVPERGMDMRPQRSVPTFGERIEERDPRGIRHQRREARRDHYDQ